STPRISSSSRPALPASLPSSTGRTAMSTGFRVASAGSAVNDGEAVSGGTVSQAARSANGTNANASDLLTMTGTSAAIRRHHSSRAGPAHARRRPLPPPRSAPWSCPGALAARAGLAHAAGRGAAPVARPGVGGGEAEPPRRRGDLELVHRQRRSDDGNG